MLTTGSDTTGTIANVAISDDANAINIKRAIGPGDIADCVLTLEDVTTEALHDLGEMINGVNMANGWDVCRPEDFSAGGGPYKIPAVIALCHSELSEALEAFRHGDRDHFLEEMADTFIRVLDCTHGLDMDLAGAVFRKLAVNRARGYRHGGKRV